MENTITNIVGVIAIIQMVRSIYYYYFKKDYVRANNYLLWAILAWLLFKF